MRSARGDCGCLPGWLRGRVRLQGAADVPTRGRQERQRYASGKCVQLFHLLYLQGTPLKFECPADLHFNDRLKVCDYQLNASCVPLTTQEPPELVTTDVAVANATVRREFISETASDVDVDGADVVTVAKPVVSTVAGPTESNSNDVDPSLDHGSDASERAFCGCLAGPGGSYGWTGAAWLSVHGRHGCPRDASCLYELLRLLPL